MTDDPNLENMGSDFVKVSSNGNIEENDGVQKISVSDNMNGLQQNSDSFVVDVERFTHILDKDINANSRFTLLRNLSRKGSGKGIVTTSPTRATLLGGSSAPESPTAAPSVSPDHSIVSQIHHITVASSAIACTADASESKLGVRKSSFRRTQISIITPRKILIYFATLSSFGTILLIYFTLSMSKMNGDGGSILD